MKMRAGGQKRAKTGPSAQEWSKTRLGLGDDGEWLVFDVNACCWLEMSPSCQNRAENVCFVL
jgi:hypothetical protein